MRTTFLLAMAAAVACNGDKTTATGETGGDTGPIDTMVMGGFTLNGVALDAAAQTPAAEGLCAGLVDPTAALGGGAPVTLVSTTIGAAGAFSFTDVVTTSTVGLLVDVRDCDAMAGTVYPSATGISAASYTGLGEGDVLDGQVAFSIDAAFETGLEASAGAAQYAGDLGADGYMFGFTLDSAGLPVGGATVECLGTCNATYYLDADQSDGLFTNPGGLNTSTDAAAGAIFVIPAAPIGQYSASDGGLHTFGSQLNGSNPGIATITAFYAD